MIKEINITDDVKLFAFQLVNEEDLSFRPDNGLLDYINIKTQASIYSADEGIQLNQLFGKCFSICELMGEPLLQRLKVGIYAEN